MTRRTVADRVGTEVEGKLAGGRRRLGWAHRPQTVIPAAARRAVARAIERLEPRQLLAADTFTGSGAWTDASHWSLNAVPGSGDTATVAAGATVTVAAAEPASGVTNLGTIDLTTDAATFTVGFYQYVTNSGTIAKTGGTGTTVLIAGNIGGTVVDNGGTLTAATGTLSIQSGATLTGTHFAPAAGASVAFDQYSAATTGGYSNSTSIAGTLTGTGSGTVLFRSGSIYDLHQTTGDAIAAGTLNFPAGMAQVTGFGLEIYGDDAQVINAGELDYVGSAAHADFNIDNTGTIVNKGTTDLVNGNQTGFVNDTTGTIDLTTDAGIGYQNNGHGGSSSFTNKGLIEKTGGTGVSTVGTNATIAFDNEGGRFSVTSGTLLLAGGDTLAGGTGIDTAAGTTFEFDLDNATTGQTGQSATLGGTLTGTGSGTVLFNSGSFYNQHQSTTDGIATGTLSFPAGMAQVTGASFESNGIQVLNAGELDYVGSAAHGEINLENAGTIVNKGTADLTDGNQTAFVNDATGVIDLTTDAGVSYVYNGHGGSLSFTNKGLIEKTGGTGTSYLGDSAAANSIGFENLGGSITVSTGNLDLVNGHGDAAYTYGPLTVATGSVFDIDLGSGGLHTSGTFAVAGGGTVQFNSGQWAGPSSSYGQDTTTPATLAFAAGTFQLRGGDFADETNLVNTGEIDLAGANDLSFLDNKGIVRVTDAGPLLSVDGFLNDTGGLLKFEADAVVTDGYHANITNDGTIDKSGGTGTIDLSSNSITNNGTIECGSGTIKLGNYGSTLPAGQTFQADSGGTIVTEDNDITDVEGTAILGGPGASIPSIAGLTTVGGTLKVLSGASFTTAGSLSVGGTMTVGGHVAVTGSLAQGGTLGFAVAAASGTSAAPLLTVAGATTLAGELQVAVTSDMTITAGTTYTVATFASPASGSFASTDATDFTPTVSPTTIVLNSTGTVSPTPTPTGTTTPTGTLTPAVVRSTVPATVVGTIRHAGRVTVSVTSTAAAISTAKDSLTLYATTTGAVDSASLVLATISRKLTFKPGKAVLFNLPVQTQNLPAGTYTLLAQTTDATGLLTTAAAGPLLVVAPPVVALSATVGAVAPLAPRAGKKASIVVSLVNSGNVDSTASLTITLGLSTDGTTTVAVPLTSASHRPRVSANHKPVKLKVAFTLPTTLTATTYYPVVTVTGTVAIVSPATSVAVGPAFTPVAAG